MYRLIALSTLLATACGDSETAAPEPATPAPAAEAEPEAQASIEWQWDNSPDLYPAIDITFSGGDAEYTLVGGDRSTKARLVRTDGWAIDYPNAKKAAVEGASAIADEDRVYVAYYNRIAAGCTMTGFSAENGKILWSVRLKGVGNVAHSKYQNRVQIALIDGDPVAFGNESARYIEQRDGETGALVHHEALPADPFVRPLAEPLYAELVEKLRMSSPVEVGIDKFVAAQQLGGGLPAGEERIAAFRDAAAYVTGKPVRGRDWQITAEVAEQKGKHVVRASRLESADDSVDQ